MNAKEFLQSKGQAAQSSVRFLNAGTPTMISLESLLEEYAAIQNEVTIKQRPPKITIKGTEINTSKRKKGSK